MGRFKNIQINKINKCEIDCTNSYNKKIRGKMFDNVIKINKLFLFLFLVLIILIQSVNAIYPNPPNADTVQGYVKKIGGVINNARIEIFTNSRTLSCGFDSDCCANCTGSAGYYYSGVDGSYAISTSDLIYPKAVNNCLFGNRAAGSSCEADIDTSTDRVWIKVNGSTALPTPMGDYISSLNKNWSYFWQDSKSAFILNATLAPIASAEPVITLSKTDSSNPVRGAKLNYTIIVTVSGAIAKNVTINEKYSINTTFVSAKPVPTTGNNIWKFVNLSVGTYRLNISMSINNATLQNGTRLINLVNTTYLNSTNGKLLAKANKTTIFEKMVNMPPSFSVVTVDNSGILNPTNIGLNVTFTATGIDPNGDQYKLLICNTSSITGVNCTAKKICSSGLINSGSSASCKHNTLGELLKNYTWYSFVCDSLLCSVAQNANSPYFVNHKPVSTIIPNMKWKEDVVNTTLDLDNYFSDPDNHILNCTATSAPNITINIAGTNVVTLTPHTNFNGINIVRFTCSDSYGLFNTSNLVTLNVTPVNDPPTLPLIDLIPNSPLDTDKLYCNVTTPSIDPEGSAITYTYKWFNGTNLFMKTITPALFTYVGAGNTSTSEKWTCNVSASDGELNTTEATDHVTLGNNPPTSLIIPNQSWLMNTNNTNAFDLDNYFIDPEGQNMTYTYTSVDNISVIINANNSVTFVPVNTWYGTRYIIFYANDSVNKVASNNVTLYVYGCGDNVCNNGETCSSCSVDCGSCGGCTGGGCGGCSGSGCGPIYRPTPSPTPTPEIIETPTPSPTPRLVRALNLTILNDPVWDLENPFNIEVSVKNNGEIQLQNVVISSTKFVTGLTSDIIVDKLDVNEEKRFTISYNPNLCADNNPEEYVIYNSLLEIKLVAQTEGVYDNESKMIKLDSRKLIVNTPHKEYGKNELLPVCLIISNPNNETINGAEFEIRVDNVEKSYIVDFLSSYIIPENSVYVIQKKYSLNFVPYDGNYSLIADYLDRGKLFFKSYLNSHDNKTIKLSTGYVNNSLISLKFIFEPLQIENKNLVYVTGFGDSVSNIISVGQLMQFNKEGEEHTIAIDNVNLDGSLSITISSEPQKLNISLNESKTVDLDGDLIPDVEVYVEQVNGEYKVKVSDVKTKAVIKESPGLVAYNPLSINNLITIMFIIVLTFLFIGVIIISRFVD